MSATDTKNLEIREGGYDNYGSGEESGRQSLADWTPAEERKAKLK